MTENVIRLKSASRHGLVVLLMLSFAWLSATAQEDTAQEDTAQEDTAQEDTAQEDTAQATETKAPAAAKSSSKKIVSGKIDGEITLAESAFVRRLVEEAALQEADVLAIELNTFGGRVDAAVAIRDQLLDAPMQTVIFINRRAISAGALISLACEKIAIASGGTIGAATPVTQAAGQVAQPVEEKYVSYFRAEMRSTAETRGRNGDIAEAMVDADMEVSDISEKGKLLTLNTRTALEYGIADVEATSLEDALEKLGIHGQAEPLSRSWSENMVGFLTSAAVASLLGVLMMFLAYLEYQTPGFGGFGFGALVCFLLLYFGHYMVNLAGWEELLFFLLGMVLILVEIFVLPGFGVAGIFGILSILVSFVMLLMAGDWSDFTFNNPFTLQAITQVSLTFLVSLVAVLMLIYWLPKSNSPLLNGRLVLTQGLDTEAGFQSHETPTDDLIGQTGETLTPLRPAGKALIDGRRRNVETEGDFVDAGTSVRVLRQEEGRIVVRQA